MNNQLEQLIRNNPHIWQGNATHNNDVIGSPTGYPSLDAILPESGWPKNTMVEMISSHWGIGELQLLLPLMKSMTEQKRWILWVCPPYIPYAPALTRAGVDINYLVTVDPNISCKDAMWTIEKALQSQSCGLVISWVNNLPNTVLRRLQLAANKGETSCILFRKQRNKNSPASLQLQLKHTERGIHAHILKARGTHRHQSADIALSYH